MIVTDLLTVCTFCIAQSQSHSQDELKYTNTHIEVSLVKYILAAYVCANMDDYSIIVLALFSCISSLALCHPKYCIVTVHTVG